jgi:hypothetical protein
MLQKSMSRDFIAGMALILWLGLVLAYIYLR